MRGGDCRLGFWRVRDRGHGAFGIQQVIFARPQTKFDQGPRVGHGLALPSVVGLIAPHSFFTGLVPGAGRGASQIMLADQSLLNG